MLMLTWSADLVNTEVATRHAIPGPGFDPFGLDLLFEVP
jgi:hypothetical protein